MYFCKCIGFFIVKEIIEANSDFICHISAFCITVKEGKRKKMHFRLKIMAEDLDGLCTPSVNHCYK